MSLMAESPHSSSSSEDFAVFLDAELEVASSDTSPVDNAKDDNLLQEDDVDVSPFNGFDESDFPERRLKRRKFDNEDATEVQGYMNIEIKEEITATISTSTKESICPPHPGFIKDMCVRCGQVVEDDGSGVAFGYIHKDLKLGAAEIDRLREADLRSSLQNKKLILILDLDHTLINSARLPDLTVDEQYLVNLADQQRDDPQRSLFKLDKMNMMTKLRPFVRKFLEEANHLFEMYIYTMGERSYALEIAKILDPESLYFKSNVISQADCTRRHQKGLDVILGAENIVVILDDTEFVWQKHKENLILMERYHYFTSSCRQFGFSAKSLSESMMDEAELDGALATILNVLKKTHQMFFDTVQGDDYSSCDVRQVLKRVRREILHGCKIVFSRVFPSKCKAEDQLIWRMAEQLGALCVTEGDSSVTHVVSTDTGTQKARWALLNEKFLVNPRWIEAANYRWQRQKEADYGVTTSKEA